MVRLKLLNAETWQSHNTIKTKLMLSARPLPTFQINSGALDTYQQVLSEWWWSAPIASKWVYDQSLATFCIGVKWSKQIWPTLYTYSIVGAVIGTDSVDHRGQSGDSIVAWCPVGDVKLHSDQTLLFDVLYGYQGPVLVSSQLRNRTKYVKCLCYSHYQQCLAISTLIIFFSYNHHHLYPAAIRDVGHNCFFCIYYKQRAAVFWKAKQ